MKCCNGMTSNGLEHEAVVMFVSRRDGRINHAWKL